MRPSFFFSLQPRRLASWSALLALPLLMSLWWQAADASMLLSSNNLSFRLPTFDYFEAPQPFYNVTGILIYPQFDAGRHCTLQPSFPTDLGLLAQSYNASVVTFNWNEAEHAGCDTIAQAAAAVFNYATTLRAKTQLPPVRLFLLQLTHIVYGYSGGPETEQYLSSSALIPDGTPKITTALVPAEHTAELRAFLDKLINVPIITVAQEWGPWNKLFRSLLFGIISFFFLTMNAIFLLFSFYRLYHVIRKKEFRFERRNIIYVTGVLAAILTISHIPLQKQTLARYILSQCSALFAAQAFYGLLLLWSNIFEMTRRRKELQLLNYLVYFAMALQVVAFISQIAATLLRQPAWMSVWLSVVFWAMPATQMIICGIYVYYIYIFAKQQREIIVSKQTLYALRWLSCLALAGLFSFVLAMIANFINAIPSLRGNPTAWAVQYQLQDLWRTIRVVALLLIMGIRIPRPMSHDQLGSGDDRAYASKSSYGRTHPYSSTPWPAV
ncbi:hypothetical protein SYNPS1DRAFT_28194 [Syncephalis pseudoplumigaleata]|uniref:Lung seven transmembrane receptor-domain-containing protein n=1 Tax=Syncephalis pseudoplumigaleata TaxID=1712513 RepID=A0A4P9Z155_9FUNG|nr:hypothetical protein SYNPS1DRAFT_28194 [Syncephalis pseudoplumigaleata]|eukprot:RKP26096.1 hypothetical protein SYNPS1DRAFT_28194 [Syncephalis pseudoplumigaleata]